jgi:membrane protein involved in colicin uptake
MIDSQEDEICNEIEDFIETREKAVEEADKKAKSDAQKLAEEEADKKAKEEAENKKPEPKKKSGLGMFILGAVVLVATAGVVNVMSKK